MAPCCAATQLLHARWHVHANGFAHMHDHRHRAAGIDEGRSIVILTPRHNAPTAACPVPCEAYHPNNSEPGHERPECPPTLGGDYAIFQPLRNYSKNKWGRCSDTAAFVSGGIGGPRGPVCNAATVRDPQASDLGQCATRSPQGSNQMTPRFTPLAAFLALYAASGLAADPVSTLEEVRVTAERGLPLGSGSASLTPAEIAPKRARTSDTASLLAGYPRDERLWRRGGVQPAGHPRPGG